MAIPDSLPDQAGADMRCTPNMANQKDAGGAPDSEKLSPTRRCRSFRDDY